jgi:cell division septum initiation protein DivIVA
VSELGVDGAAENVTSSDRTPGSAASTETAATSTTAPAGITALPHALFGYDREATRKAFDELTTRHDELAAERMRLAERVEELELELLRRQEGERLIGETLVLAKREAQSIRDDAQRAAAEVVEAAQTRAKDLLDEAEAQSRARAKEVFDEAERERDALREEAGRTKAFIQETREHLSDFLLASVKLYEEAEQGQPALDVSAHAQQPPAAGEQP